MNWSRKLGWALLSAGALLLSAFLIPTLYGEAMSRLAVHQYRAHGTPNRRWDSARMRAYRQALTLSFAPPEAILRVPRVGIEVPVFEGTSELILNRGAGHIPGTALPGEPGNLAIAGHRDGFFRALKDVRTNDVIEIQHEVQRPVGTGSAAHTTDRYTDRYVVRSIQVVLPEDVSVLQPTPRATLTLVTCFPFYFVGSAPKRYIVQALLLGPRARASPSNRTPQQENPMQTRLATARIATALLALALPIAAHAAALTSGPSSTVVYVGGNDVVLKSSEGKLLNFTVPAGYKFSAGAKELSLAELKPGTSLTKPVAPGIDPKLVTAVAVVKGKVYAVTPPNALTLTLSDGAKELIVPAGTTFTVDGKRLPIAEIKPDMMVEATIVTTAAEGAATTAAAPTTPPLAGALLVANTPAAGEAELPLAGTNLPLFGLLGLCLLAAGAALLKLRPTTHA